MNTKNLLLTLLMSVVFVFGTANTYADNKKENKDKKTVVIKADIHCKSCKAKLEKNIPFEKGVRDLKVDMEAKTITITYKADKNNEASLIKAIEKCGVKVIKEDACTGNCGANCCKVTGDKSKCCKKGHSHDHEKCDKDHSKEHKCTGDCKSCKHKSCTKAGTEEKCDGKCDKKDCRKDCNKEEKHNCSGCSGCSH